MRRLVGLLPCLLLGACFEYRPVAPASAPPQAAEVRVRLSRPMDFPIHDVTVRDVVELQGEVAAVADSSMRLSVFGLRSQTGYGVDASGETVEFPRTAVVGLARKRLSPWRSAVFGVLLAGGAVALQQSGLANTFSGGHKSPGGTK